MRCRWTLLYSLDMLWHADVMFDRYLFYLLCILCNFGLRCLRFSAGLLLCCLDFNKVVKNKEIGRR